MNPLTRTARSQRVEAEVRRIREAWPEAQVRYNAERVGATVVIRDPLSTYIIEVESGDTDVVTRSLWVSHRVPIGPDSEHVPQWTEGWVD